MQVSTLSAHFGLGSELVDWYRDATSVPYGHLLVATHRRSITLLYKHRIHSLKKFFYRTGWNSQISWTMSTQNLSTLQIFQSFSHKFKSLFLQSCPKEFIRFLCECITSLLKGNLQSIKRRQRAKFQREVQLLSLERTTWQQTRDILISQKRLQLFKVITPPVLNIFSWFGAVSPRSCFCVQQKFD